MPSVTAVTDRAAGMSRKSDSPSGSYVQALSYLHTVGQVAGAADTTAGQR